MENIQVASEPAHYATLLTVLELGRGQGLGLLSCTETESYTSYY